MAKGKIATFDHLFKMDEKEDEKERELDNDKSKLYNIYELKHFPNHPFKLYEKDKLEELAESIKHNGLISPIILWKKENDLIILSGHNRVEACKLIDKEEVEGILKEGLNEDEALLIVTESNIHQRSWSDLSISEKAKIIAINHEANKAQGKRTDLINEISDLMKSQNINDSETSSTEWKKLSSSSKAQYIRVDKLNNELKSYLDNERIALKAGVELSHLDDDKQEIIECILDEENKCKIDLNKAKLLREKGDKLDHKLVKNIIMGEYNRKPPKPIVDTGYKITSNILKRYINENTTKNEMDKIIEKALNMYFERLETNHLHEDEELEV